MLIWVTLLVNSTNSFVHTVKSTVLILILLNTTVHPPRALIKMTPFHALYPPVTMYQQPEPLAWMINPSSLNEEGKILSVLKILCGLRMTVMDLMLYSISERPSMATWREGFFRSKALVQFLNVLDMDE
jgi:hypothetical protein